MAKKARKIKYVLMIPEGETRATATYHFVKEKTGNQWSQNKKFRRKHYHPKLRKHCWFVETKMPSHSKQERSMKAMIIGIAMLGLASCSSIPGIADKSYADLPTHDHIKCTGSCDVKLKQEQYD